MAHPDPGPLLDEQLDELELICAASERGGEFDTAAMAILCSGTAEDFEALDYVIGWHDRHDRKLLEAARWALSHGWRRGNDGDAADGRCERVMWLVWHPGATEAFCSSHREDWAWSHLEDRMRMDMKTAQAAGWRCSRIVGEEADGE